MSDERIPVGTHVRYHGEEWIIRAHNDLARHTKLFPAVESEYWQKQFPDGIGYELWPLDVLYKFGNRCYSRTYVRRRSFEVIDD